MIWFMNYFENQPMNCESLYQEFKWKQYNNRKMQANQQSKIQARCNQTNLSFKSSEILLHKTTSILDQFPDDQIINLQASIPLLQNAGILQVLESVEDAKEKLKEKNGEQSRLRDEAEFLYYLWHLIEEQEIQTGYLKQIIEVLQSKKKNELKSIFLKEYKDEQRVQMLVRSWNALVFNQQYYKYMGRVQNRNRHQQSDHTSFSTFNDNKCSPIYQQCSSNLPLLAETTNFTPHQLTIGCQLSETQQKQLVERLYRKDIYKMREKQKQEMQSQREEQQLKKCTFKPSIIKRGKSANRPSQSSSIKGYEQAVTRLKTGNEKNKISKQMRDYKPIGENYEKIKQKGINPPKFLERKKKEEEKVLFIISFDLGRHKTNVKIRENDTEDSVAEKICKIYSLKQEFYDEIKLIVRSQLDAYYQEIEGIENIQQIHET